MINRTLDCRGVSIPLGKRTLIMGILNVTPDSFSDGGRYNTVETAVSKARELVRDGADILDIGGESTRPGAEAVSLEEELGRVIPVIEAVSKELNVAISVDTYKVEVARQALRAGAHILNDIWGFKGDPVMAGTAAEYGCPVVLMHNRRVAEYTDFLADVVADLQESVRIAREAGVQDSMIILDPGIGFAKDQAQNLYLLKHLGKITALGYPVLLGTSRKRVIRNVLGLPPGEAEEGTAATVALGAAQGAAIMRVHDVRTMKRVALMTDAVLQAEL
jgi:dihydropteroate synthase